MKVKCIRQSKLSQMKVKNIHTKLFESNESQTLSQMKVKHIQTIRFESNDSQMHSTNLIELNES